jgi:hypothetical protein
MDRNSAQPQVNLSLLRSNSLKFQPHRSFGPGSKSLICFMAPNLFAEDFQMQSLCKWVNTYGTVYIVHGTVPYVHKHCAF